MRSTAFLLIELVVLLLVVAFAVEILQRRVGPERLRLWMGGTPLVAALKGIAVGFVTPFCTYSAVPLLIGLRRADVPPAGYVAFIVAAPVAGRVGNVGPECDDPSAIVRSAAGGRCWHRPGHRGVRVAGYCGASHR